MYKEERIDTIEQLRELFFDQTYNPDIGRYRNLYVYRGMPNSDFKLLTSLQRNCKDKKEVLEENIYNNFAKYAELENQSVTQSVWRKIILGQHHGLPTRLLDWSRSPLMALHFATDESFDSLDQHDCVLWRIDISKINRTLPEQYQQMIKKSNQQVFTVDMLEEMDLCLKTYDEDMQTNSMIMMEPPTIDMRIANQYSFFSIVPSQATKLEDILENYNEDEVVRYVINKNLKWQLRDMLDQANINERIIYPGLDGIAKWLSRYYFVRNLSKLEIKTVNIADFEADVIVRPTEYFLGNHGSVSKAIFNQAGKDLESKCEELGKQEHGIIVETDGYKLKAKHIYHVILSNYSDSTKELEDLYDAILNQAFNEGYHSIAFPLMGSGFIGYPVEVAWQIGLEHCKKFIEDKKSEPLTITFCVLNEEQRYIGQGKLDEMEGKQTLNSSKASTVHDRIKEE